VRASATLNTHTHGRCDPSAAKLYRCARLLALSKAPKPGTRPLAIGSSDVRCSLRAAAVQRRDEMCHWFTSEADLRALEAAEGPGGSASLSPAEAASLVVHARVLAQQASRAASRAASDQALADSPLGTSAPSTWDDGDPPTTDEDASIEPFDAQGPSHASPSTPATRAADRHRRAQAATAARAAARDTPLISNAQHVPIQFGVACPGRR